MIFTGEGWSTWCIEYEMHGECLCFVVWGSEGVKSVLWSCGEK